jgi:hypothetical protein
VVQLLAVLCLLLDGLLRWRERLRDIGSKFENVHGLLQSLRRTSLVFIENDALKVLSPIRHFMIDHYPAAEDLVKGLEAYFWNLVAIYAIFEPGDGFMEAKQILEPDMGNMCNLVQNNVQSQMATETIEIALKISWFSIWTHPSADILELVMPETAESKVGSPSLHAQCSHSLGEILYMQSNYEEAADVLNLWKLAISLVQLNAHTDWAILFACSPTMRMQTFSKTPKTCLPNLVISLVQLNAHVAWVIFFTFSPAMRPSENQHEGDIAKSRDMVAPPGDLRSIEGDHEIHLFSPTDFKNQLDSLTQATTFPL